MLIKKRTKNDLKNRFKNRLKKVVKKRCDFFSEKTKEKSKRKFTQKIKEKNSGFFKRQNYKKYRYYLTILKKRLFQKPPTKNFYKKMFVFCFNFMYIFRVIFSRGNFDKERWRKYEQRKLHYLFTRCEQSF